MKLKMPNGYIQDPSDQEIERDVAELRKLMEGVDPRGYEEPHPAYHQNFLVRVRGRIDQEQARRKRRSVLTTWGSLTAAAVIAVVIVTDGLPGSGGRVIEPGGNGGGAVAAAPPAAAGERVFAEQGPNSLVLSENDVRMVNAIVDDDEAAVFEAMIDSDVF